MKITLMPGAYEGNCIECGKHFIRRQIDSFDDGAFCARHYKEWQKEQVSSGESNYEKLFGTPERAARTLECSCHLLYGLKVDGFVACIGCPVYDNDADVDDCYYDALLEWLRGDAE